MTAQLATDALMMTIWLRGNPMPVEPVHHRSPALDQLIASESRFPANIRNKICDQRSFDFWSLNRYRRSQ